MAKNISKTPTTINAIFKILAIVDVLESETELTLLTVVDAVLLYVLLETKLLVLLLDVKLESVTVLEGAIVLFSVKFKSIA